MNTTYFSTQPVRPTSDHSLVGAEQLPADTAPHQRALVLGGGGSTGNAWVIGVLAGLSDAGLDVTDADLIIGTSAGSTAAAQITGASPAELLAAVLDAPPQPSRPPAARSGAPGGAVANVMETTGRIIAASADPADARRRLAAAALEAAAASDGSRQAQWRATVAARLGDRPWPDREVMIVAVDADTGDPVVFDRASGVDLVDAVAASTSNGYPYRIGDRRYINGGYRRSAENADLAAGYERVLVLSPFAGRTRYPQDWGMELAAQVHELGAGGSSVETVVPDSGTEHLFGVHAMDFSLRPPAARVGHEQGAALAERLAGFWR